ncbi:indole-3-glycerol-phosphate synthase [Candidatus Daviesbacteria bacterium]|nr:indole-3-glycerol-phosphate synthase [Candidatus Daviesbacteria bacterium]
MHKILQDIINSTAKEVKKRKSQSSMDDLVSYGHLPFKQRILNPRIGDIGLIAEIKLASPSEGKLGEKVDIRSRLQEYQNAGADAVSVITENNFFRGSLDLVSTVKRIILNLPILQKDFIIDDFQIEESCKSGVDALLLIASIVNVTQLKRYVKLCREKELEPVVEICSEDDLVGAIRSETEIIAVNARDLDSFEVNVDRACKLLKKIPEEFIKLGFSGVHSRSEVEKYKLAGAKAVLVGTELMKTNNINKKILELKNAS